MLEVNTSKAKRVRSILEYSGVFNSTFDSVNQETEKILYELQKVYTTLHPKAKFIFDFAIRELLNNAVEHGNKMMESKRVEYFISISHQMFSIKVSDEGEGFDFTNVLKNERQDCEMRIRNRGLVALCDMGFVFQQVNKGIEAKLLLGGELKIMERAGNMMEVVIENGIAKCVVMKGLVSPNIKQMIEILKVELDDRVEYHSIIVDLSQVESIDSMGITFLVGIFKTFRGKEKEVTLKGVSESILELFKIMKLIEFFEIK